MIPNTYYFVELYIDEKLYTYGPYFDLEYATVIMVDFCPSIASSLAEKANYKYESKLCEKILQSSDWVTLNIHVLENMSYRKRKR